MNNLFWFLGVAPPSAVAIQSGKTLHQLASARDAVSVTSYIMLTVFALAALLPILFRKKLQEKID